MAEPTSETIGKGWIMAILALLALLIVGVILYLRMSAPLNHPRQRVAIAHVTNVAASLPYVARTGYMSNGVR